MRGTCKRVGGNAAIEPIELAGELNLATVGDFFALLKPRVMSLVVFTGLAGLVLAPGTIHIATALHRAALHRGRGGRVGRAQHGL